MARSKNNGFRLDLGDELNAKLEDFCAAYYRANKTEVIREALDSHIDSVLAREPERKRRYDEARQRRRIEGAHLRLVPTAKARPPKRQTRRDP